MTDETYSTAGTGPSVASRAERRANAALQIGRAQIALEEASRAIAADPTMAAAHATRARALLDLKRHDEALATAEAGLVQCPDSEWLHRLRAVALLNRREPLAALRAVAEALRLLPRNALAFLIQSQAYAHLGRKADALEAVLDGLDVAPEQIDLLFQRGVLLLEDDAAHAARTFREVLALDPRHPMAMNNLGVALERQGRTREALVAYREALAVDPNAAVTKQNLRQIVERLYAPSLPRYALWGFMVLLSPLAWMIPLVRRVCVRIRLRRGDPELRELYARLLRDPDARTG